MLKFRSGMPILLFALLLGSAIGGEPESREQAEEMVDLTSLSLEQLMNIEVVTVSRKGQRQFSVPSAIHVLTNEDIRRSGAQSVPDALRLVPGVQVARINANRWAISSRGFKEYYANNLLTMIDGRVIYSPTFAATLWEEHDVLMEDLDRIEVVRGPGATSWGANAVNGVINLMTKNSKDTQGWLLSTGIGDEMHNISSFRYGGRLSDAATFRVFGKYSNYDDLKFEKYYELPDNGDAHDGWEMGHFGFRMDWELEDDVFCLQGDIHENRYDTMFRRYNPETDINEIHKADDESAGGNLLGRWTHTFSESSDLTIQIYFDRLKKIISYASTRCDAYDFDMQHRFQLGGRQEIVWGMGYRFLSDSIDSSREMVIDPEKRKENLFSTFIQDEIALIKEKLSLTIGSKFIHNYHTGFEIQPSARLAWTLLERFMMWGAVSRAVRTPSRWEDDITNTIFIDRGNGLSTGRWEAKGDDWMRAEVVHTYEAGLRLAPTGTLMFDLSGFWTFHDRVVNINESQRGVVVDSSTVPPTMSMQVRQNFDNLSHGVSWGAELSAKWDVKEWWQMTGGYSSFRLELYNHNTDDSYEYDYQYGTGPKNQAFITSHFDLPRGVELDLIGRYMDADTLRDRRIPSYADMDVRVGWKPNEKLEISLIGQNLLDSTRPEFESVISNSAHMTENQRSFFAKLIVRF